MHVFNLICTDTTAYMHENSCIYIRLYITVYACTKLYLGVYNYNDSNCGQLKTTAGKRAAVLVKVSRGVGLVDLCIGVFQYLCIGVFVSRGWD